MLKDVTWEEPIILRIGNANVKLEYMLEGDTDYTELGEALADPSNENNKLELNYVRTSGGFKNSKISGTDMGKPCIAIKYSLGTYESSFNLIRVTGKVTYN